MPVQIPAATRGYSDYILYPNLTETAVQDATPTESYGNFGLKIFLRRRSPGVLKGTLRVSLRDRCATPDLPVRSQDRAAIGVRGKTGQAAAGFGRATAWVYRDCKTVISGDDPSPVHGWSGYPGQCRDAID